MRPTHFACSYSANESSSTSNEWNWSGGKYTCKVVERHKELFSKHIVQDGTLFTQENRQTFEFLLYETRWRSEVDGIREEKHRRSEYFRKSNNKWISEFLTLSLSGRIFHFWVALTSTQSYWREVFTRLLNSFEPASSGFHEFASTLSCMKRKWSYLVEGWKSSRQ